MEDGATRHAADSLWFRRRPSGWPLGLGWGFRGSLASNHFLGHKAGPRWAAALTTMSKDPGSCPAWDDGLRLQPVGACREVDRRSVHFMGHKDQGVAVKAVPDAAPLFVRPAVPSLELRQSKGV